VLIGITGFLLVLALIAGMSQNVLADPLIIPNGPVPAACDPPSGLNCAQCQTCNNSCGVGNQCAAKCTATDGSCPGCNCKIPAGQSCGCYK
jgi:hypothetical protein